MHRTTLTVLKTQAHVYFPCQRRDRLMRDRLRCCCFLQQCFLAWLPLSAEPGSTIKISYDIRIGSRTALHQTGQTYPPSEVVVLALFPFVASALLLQTLAPYQLARHTPMTLRRSERCSPPAVPDGHTVKGRYTACAWQCVRMRLAAP